MSDHLSSAPRQGDLRNGEGDGRKACGGESRGQGGGGGRVKVYLHAVTDEQAARLAESGNKRPLQEICKKSGADVQLDSNPSPVAGVKIVIIRGLSHQIEAAVRVISQMKGAKLQRSISAQAQTFWLQWAEDAFPDLDSRAYFLPPVHFNRVPISRGSTAGQEVLVLRGAPGQPGQSTPGQVDQSEHSPMILSDADQTSMPQPPSVQDSDVRDDAAMQRILFCLKEIAEKNGEVLVGLTQLRFGQYLGEPCYAAAAVLLPISANLPPVFPLNWKQGDFDVLLIHRQYGLVVCEVKSLGDCVKNLDMAQQNVHENITKRLKDTISSLNKAEAMLTHLVSDIASGVRITKTIALPNLTASQVHQAISDDPQVTQELCQCLGATDSIDISGLILCSDQLSDPKTPWDVSSHMLRELGNWWQRRVAVSGPDSLMTCDVYKSVLARFCGPATTVTVPCISPPRLCVKTLGQAVSLTGELYTAQITLFPEQVHLLNTAPPRLFVTGPPGTGKTVVLQLMATEWLIRSNDVYIVSTWRASLTVCCMLYHLLTHAVCMQLEVPEGRTHLLQYNFEDKQDVERAVNDLSQLARGGSLYVTADEAGPEKNPAFQTFCEGLMKKVPCLHLWAASCFCGDAPAGWQVERLTKCLRSPPAVVREVQQDKRIAEWRDVPTYSERGVPDHTDGPPVRRLYHRGQGHSGDLPRDCITCGREVASFLHSLRVGDPARQVRTCESVSSTKCIMAPPYLQWRDVVVLYCWHAVSDSSGIVKGLTAAGIPARVLTDNDIDDVAKAQSDVLWLASEYRVYGLERKVVVCLESNIDRVHSMSRCTSQLVIVYEDCHSLRRSISNDESTGAGVSF